MLKQLEIILSGCVGKSATYGNCTEMLDKNSQTLEMEGILTLLLSSSLLLLLRQTHDTANNDCRLTKSIAQQKIYNTIKTVH